MSKKHKQKYFAYNWTPQPKQAQQKERILSLEHQEAWTTGEKQNCATGCNYKSDVERKIILSPEVFGVVRKLCAHIKTEFQVLLSGTIEQGNCICTGYYIPKQEVNFAHVTNNDCIDVDFIRQHCIVATLHSHASIECFFSGTDSEMTNTNTGAILYHVVTNNKNNFIGCYVELLPCGQRRQTACDVELQSATIENIVGIENITQQRISGYYDYDLDKSWHECII